MKFSAIYGTGAVMGFSPRDVDEMSLWEFVACQKAYAKAHGAKDDRSGDAMSESRMRDLGLL